LLKQLSTLCISGNEIPLISNNNSWNPYRGIYVKIQFFWPFLFLVSVRQNINKSHITNCLEIKLPLGQRRKKCLFSGWKRIPKTSTQLMKKWSLNLKSPDQVHLWNIILWKIFFSPILLAEIISLTHLTYLFPSTLNFGKKRSKVSILYGKTDLFSSQNTAWHVKSCEIWLNNMCFASNVRFW